MEGDRRSFRVALTADRYVNPPPGGMDGLAVLGGAGWGVVQLPPEDYPAELASVLLREVAEQAEEFWRFGYDVVTVGDHAGLVDALGAAGMPPPDAIAPSNADELLAFLAERPEPSAARLLG
ncbi:MAG: hypothetical protein ACYCUG_01705 [Acidimicrobiales bacterium]